MSVGGNIRCTGNINTETNLTVTGTSTHTGTSTLTGRVGIAKAPHATYPLDVLGDINVSGAFRINGSALTSWLANTVDATRIYYNTGNVGIGTTNPAAKLHIVNSSTTSNPDTGITGLYVFNPTNSAGQNGVITNRIGGSSAG